jgi:hypothetical protein
MRIAWSKYAWKHFMLMLSAVLVNTLLVAQDNEPAAIHIRHNTIYITIDKNISEKTFIAFTHKYNLRDIGLYQFLATGKKDSLEKFGWKISSQDKNDYTITKQFDANAPFKNPTDKMIFYAVPTPDTWRIVGDNRVIYGSNHFKNKKDFRRENGVVEFELKGYKDVESVRLAGNFTNWQHDAFPMTKTEQGWVASVKLDPGAYYYKFIINDNYWIVDPDNEIVENDGRGNMNSVYYIPNKIIRLDGYTDADAVYISGSFNNWAEDQLALSKTKGGWEIPLYLEPGTHRYQFIVDGKAISSNEKDRSTASIGDAYLFKLKGFSGAKRVALAGNFNDWNPGELWMKKTADGWELPYALGPGNYQYKFIVDGKWMTDPAHNRIVDDGRGNHNSFLVVKPNYRFVLKGHRNAKNISVAGDFNDWQENVCEMKQENGEWVARVYLGRGKHRYRFVVDGEWMLDPQNKLWEDTENGNTNSVVWIE